MTEATNEVKTVTINGGEIKVEDLSESDRIMINLFVSWNQDEMKIKNDLLKVQAAKRDIERELNARVEKLRAEGKVTDPVVDPVVDGGAV